MSDEIPPLEDDRVAMMLGLVPDKRTPIERLVDVIRTNGASARYRYNPETGASEYDEAPEETT